MPADEHICLGILQFQQREKLFEVRCVADAELLVVVLADPVHVDQIGRAYCPGWSARDDDHEISPLIALHLQQCRIHLLNHAVGGLHDRDDEGFRPHVSASWLRTSGSG